MKTKKPLIVRIFIWICVFAMVISLIWVYVVYMFAPAQSETENIDSWEIQQENLIDNTEEINSEVEEISEENNEEISGEIGEIHEDSEDFNLVTEDGEIEEMDQTTEVQLENGETELIRLGDLSDTIQIN